MQNDPGLNPGPYEPTQHNVVVGGSNLQPTGGIRRLLYRLRVLIWPPYASLMHRATTITSAVAVLLAMAVIGVIVITPDMDGVRGGQITEGDRHASGGSKQVNPGDESEEDETKEDEEGQEEAGGQQGSGGNGGQQGGSSGNGGSSGGNGGSGSSGNNGNCAWPNVPDASCTGVPAGTQLTTHNGDLYVTNNGAVVDKMEVNGCIYIQANNVTIKRTRVNGWCWTGAISAGEGDYTGTVIEDVEVNGTAPSDPNIAGAALIGINNYTARRVNVHHGGRGFNMGSNVTIEDSYIHDMFGSGDSHNSGIGSNSGVNITLRHNNINCDIGQPGNPSTGGGCSGALVLYADTFGDQIGSIDNLLIEQNRFNAGAGSYCLLIYNTRTNGTYTVRNNQFGASFNSDCGQYGPADIIKTAGATLNWQSNTWYAPGQSKHGQSVSPQVTIE